MRERESALTLFLRTVADRPVGAILGLPVEYAMFASAVPLAIALRLTRRPLAYVDGALGLDLRRRFEDALAKISPG